MRRIALLFLLCIPITVWGQNLVPNWSFEDTVACPDNLTQIDRAQGWMSFKFTPDYYNSCSNPNLIVPVAVPHNVVGDQAAHTGNAYSGFITFKSGATNSREYIAIQLNQQMIIGQKYFLSFWVSSAFGYMNMQNYPHMASNNIGAKFSTVAYSQSNPQPVNNFAHIVDTNIINDTINWIKISGSFIADSAYIYLSIGNFFTDSLTSVINIDSSFPNDAYYYLDDVKLSTDSGFVNGINNYNYDSIEIFPNPTRDWILIQGINIVSIEIFELCGKLAIPKIRVSSFSTKVNISTLRHGVYLLKAYTPKNFIIEKFIHY